jgi:hypothetical protein
VSVDSVEEYLSGSCDIRYLNVGGKKYIFAHEKLVWALRNFLNIVKKYYFWGMERSFSRVILALLKIYFFRLSPVTLSVPSFGMGSSVDLGMSTFFRGIHSESIPLNLFGT